MSIVYPTTDEIRNRAFQLYEVGGRLDGYDLADWLCAEQTLFIEKNYWFMGEHEFQSGRTTFLGSRDTRICRYCLRTAPIAKFKTIAHAVPEMLGNHSVISLDECDQCNHHFSISIEDHLGKFLGPLLTIGTVPGKHGVPSFRKPPSLSRIDFEDGVLVIRNELGDCIGTFDEEKGRGDIDVGTQPFIPIAAYKGLVKMALAIMPRHELIHFDKARLWIMNPDHEVGMPHLELLAQAHVWIQPGLLGAEHGRAWLLKRRSVDANLPHMLFMVEFGACAIQIIVPCTKLDDHWLGEPVALPLVPQFVGIGYEFGECEHQAWPLISTKKQSIPLWVELKTMPNLGE